MRIVPLLLAASLLLAGNPARANDKAPPPAPAPSAAPAPPSSATSIAAELDTTARQLFLDADAAYQRGEHEKAYAMLLAAWKVKNHWTIAASLGAVELKIGKPADAANHFAYYLREAPADRKEKASTLLAEASAKTGVLIVTVDPPDAEILVDGVASGAKSGETIYVEPDVRHKVAARKSGETVDVEVLAMAGKTHNVTLVIPKGGTREGPRKEIVIAGAAVAGASVIAGAVLLGAALGEQGALRNDAPTNGQGMAACAAAQPANGASPTCDELRRRGQAANAMGQSGVALMIAGGAIGLATGLYAFWPRAQQSKQGSRLVPLAGPNGAGLMWIGSF